MDRTRRANVLIERDGKTAALRADSGLIFRSVTVGTYSVEKWLLADGTDHPNGVPRSTPFHCNPLGCVGQVKGKPVALIRETSALAEECRKVDSVIAPSRLGKACNAPRIVIDRTALSAQGAHALHIDELSIQTETISGKRGARPWSSAASKRDPGPCRSESANASRDETRSAETDKTGRALSSGE